MILPWQDCPFQCTQSQEFHIKSFPECAVGWCAQYGQTDMILRVPSSDYIEEPRLTICLKYREIIQALVSDTYRRGYHLRVLYQGGRDLWIMFLLNRAIVQRRVLWSSTLYKRVCVSACVCGCLSFVCAFLRPWNILWVSRRDDCGFWHKTGHGWWLCNKIQKSV